LQECEGVKLTKNKGEYPARTASEQERCVQKIGFFPRSNEVRFQYTESITLKIPTAMRRRSLIGNVQNFIALGNLHSALTVWNVKSTNPSNDGF
jgi:hypothetical protein